MTLTRSSVLALAITLFSAACSQSGSESGQFGGDMFIESCSLGCTGGSGGEQVFCSIVNAYRNQEIAIRFSEPVDPASVNSSSFRVVIPAGVDGGGTTAIGTFVVDAIDGRRLVFRPQLTFDESGTPVYGFDANTAYQILIPGSAQGDLGPFIRSVTGRANQSRLDCTIVTDQGIIDLVPGDPTVTVSVDVITGPGSGEVPETAAMFLTDSQILDNEVYSLSPITMLFTDVMNPATLTPTFVQVQVDSDGDLATTSDRIAVEGTLDVSVDLETLTTTVVFEHEIPDPFGGPNSIPTAGFPSAGEDPENPRLVVVNFLPGSVRDLDDNVLTEEGAGGSLVLPFIPESTIFSPIILPGQVDDDGIVDPFSNGAEPFTYSNDDGANQAPPGETSNQDPARSGNLWGGSTTIGATTVTGILHRETPNGGGTGRHGDMHITAGQVVTLYTGTEDPDDINSTDPGTNFPLPGMQIDVMGNADGSDLFPTELSVLDGYFEFSTLVIEAGGQLVLRGSQPARIFVRGPLHIQSGGLVDLSGTTPAPHDSARPEPETEWTIVLEEGSPDITVPNEIGPNFHDAAPLEVPVGGPGAGAGGWGGKRLDMETYLFDAGAVAIGLITAGGLVDEVFPSGTWDIDNTNGFPGEGVAAGAGTVPPGGEGGSRNPATYPLGTFMPSQAEDMAFNVEFSAILGDNGCFSRLVGGVGGGGGYSLNGCAGFSRSSEALSDAPGSSNDPSDQNCEPAAGEVGCGITDATTCGGLGLPVLANPASGGYEPPSFDDSLYTVRKLGRTVTDDFLRGGSGGGGGGNHPYETYANGVQAGSATCLTGTSTIEDWPDDDVNPGWRDHSGAAGGGGGGALQMSSGVSVLVEGVIDASGGEGGSSTTFSPSNGFFAMPGGGGSGGAVLLQAKVVVLADSAGRVDVSGGSGGSATSWAPLTVGGSGSPGLVRIETLDEGAVDPADDHEEYASSVAPYDASGTEWGQFSVDFMSVAKNDWAPRFNVPDSLSGSVSCWIAPEGNFFAVNFSEDPGAPAAPADYAWNMEIVYDDSGTVRRIPFFGTNADSDAVLGVDQAWYDPGTLYGNDMPNGGGTPEPSPIIVRFQGARINLTDDTDLCDLGVDSPIIPGTVTPWVDHPSKLNPVNGDPDRNWPEPNIIRYCVLFDFSVGDPTGSTPWALTDVVNIRGVDNLYIRADPE